MEKFVTHAGVAAPLDLVNVDTDMIIPKQYLKTIKRTGLKVGLFNELRTREDGSMIEEFSLNQPQYARATVLVAGDNFGCGSSREHAPWALLDWGFRVIIAPSFADIFYGNCFNNGILPIKLAQTQVDLLMADAQQAGRISIDLPAQEITRPNGQVIGFDLDPGLKHRLLEGLDPIGLTLQHQDDIASFEGQDDAVRPWVGRVDAQTSPQVDPPVERFSAVLLLFFSLLFGLAQAQGFDADPPGLQEVYLQTSNVVRPIDEPATSIFLTFDDGPSADLTRQLGDLLHRFGAFGNFFIIGQRAQDPSNQATLARLHAQGHLIANHTFDHAQSYTSEAAFEASLKATTRVIAPYLPDSGLVFFRSPGGAWDQRRSTWASKTALGEPDLAFASYVGPLFWNVGGALSSAGGALTDAADWRCWHEGISVQTCAQGYLAKIHANYHTRGEPSIVLLHDLRPQTVKLVQVLLWELILDPVPYQFKRLDMASWPTGWDS